MTNVSDVAYVAWQDPITKDWQVVGALSNAPQGYVFNYTKGALISERFVPFSGMPDVNSTYVSTELFPLFKNRLLSARRPEYPFFINWLKLKEDEINPVNILGRSGGIRTTDQLQMFKKIEFDEYGNFEHVFFAHGLSYVSESARNRIKRLEINERLYLASDMQNAYDKSAVLIRAENPSEILGYCPRYMAKDVREILESDKDSIEIFVESLAEDAPTNYMLMCRLKGTAKSELASRVMSRDEFQLISEFTAGN